MTPTWFDPELVNDRRRKAFVMFAGWSDLSTAIKALFTLNCRPCNSVGAALFMMAAPGAKTDLLSCLASCGYLVPSEAKIAAVKHCVDQGTLTIYICSDAYPILDIGLVPPRIRLNPAWCQYCRGTGQDMDENEWPKGGTCEECGGSGGEGKPSPWSVGQPFDSTNCVGGDTCPGCVNCQ